MINIKKIRELYIASSPFDVLDKSVLKDLNYEKWKNYIDLREDYFVWEENTQDGIFLKENIDKVPDKVRESILIELNKIRCNAEYYNKYYNIVVIFHKNLKYIVISFERRVNINDLELFLDMANYLDAYLLYNGKTIIDEKVIESLE